MNMIYAVLLAAGSLGQVGYSDGYYYQPYYQQPPVVYDYSDVLHLTLVNIPGGREFNRVYVKARVYGMYYTIPVINGVLPVITVRSRNDLVLNYRNGVVYVPNSRWDERKYGWIEYCTPDKKFTPPSGDSSDRVDLPKQPSAVKPFERKEEASGVKSPEESSSGGAGAVKLPDDEGLFNGRPRY